MYRISKRDIDDKIIIDLTGYKTIEEVNKELKRINEVETDTEYVWVFNSQTKQTHSFWTASHE